jgi:hypothetical protein
MNPILLSNWLLVCDRANIPVIPATLGPLVRIDEIYRFLEDLGTVPTLDRAYYWLHQHYRPHVNMWRWDCCSSEVLKSKLDLDKPPLLEFDLDEPRFLLALEELERRQEITVAILTRPWIKAKIEASYPVEFRAFVASDGIAVSNYHKSRPLPEVYQSVAIEVRTLAERLATETSVSSFCADFLLTSEGSLLFLEGGLGYERGGLVHPCCFDREPRSGEIALRY